METPDAPVYLKKSITFFKIYAGLFLFSLISSQVVRFIKKDYTGFLDVLVGLPFFAVFFMAPMGLFYSWKSLKRKEEPAGKRFWFFLGHLFFCIMAISAIAIALIDIAALFKS